MFDGKDPKIKLFGKTIKLPETRTGSDNSFAASTVNGVIQDPRFSANSTLKDVNFIGVAGEQELHESLIPNQSEPEKRTRAQQLSDSDEFKDSDTSPTVNNIDNGALRTAKPEEDQSNSGKLQDRTLKKPDKIVPCPRCNSMETKFCYFNNYNVNQPRHFCKNCQRYWTAGGTMRNVPVGAGRRKNKTPASPQFRLPEASVHVNAPNGSLNPNNNGNSALTFNPDTHAPLCESMATGLNLADKKNGFHQPEELVTSVSHSSKEKGGEQISVSPITIETGNTGFPVVIPNCHPFPWPYPWNSVQWTPPAFSPPNFPLPFYPNAPPPYWGCAVPPVPWAVPWVIPTTQTTSQNQNAGPISPTLGKHSRDDSTLKPADENDNTTEKCLWAPKTLRIDDPGEAAKSSIWETLGIKNDKVSNAGLFKVFHSQSKGDEKLHVPEASTVLKANPAAMSRSLNFQENS